jgi:hypothetical protein
MATYLCYRLINQITLVFRVVIKITGHLTVPSARLSYALPQLRHKHALMALAFFSLLKSDL